LIAPAGSPLAIVRDPSSARHLDPPAWDRLLPQLRRLHLHARVATDLIRSGIDASLPPPVREHMRAGQRVAAAQERSIRWEVDRIAAALDGVGSDLLLLKGAAYLLAGLPNARGRLTADVDIMVERARLPEVESALRAHGWQAVHRDEYDQGYYRRWMHELPPLRHAERDTVVDVHHTIFARVGRYASDPAKLLRRAVVIEGDPRWKRLCDEDLFLHAATHLFGEAMRNPLRDLLDLADLLALMPAGLAARAAELGLTRPLFYAVHFLDKILGIGAPKDCRSLPRPGALAFRLMDRLGTEAFLSPAPRRLGLAARAHWLRMPPHLLARHLARKAWKRVRSRREA